MAESTYEERCERAKRLVINTQKCADDMQVDADDMTEQARGVRNVVEILQKKYDAMVAKIPDHT